MAVDQGVLTVALLIVAVIAVAGLAVSVSMVLRLGRMRRQYRVLSAADGRSSFVEVVARKAEEVEALRAEVKGLRSDLRAARMELTEAIRHLAVVRYDAFGDMGGRMSFTLAMLDDNGTGVLVTTIHARSESRTYIKQIVRGEADVHLSPEEQAAVTDALGQIRG